MWLPGSFWTVFWWGQTAAPRALDEQSAVSVICSVLESRPGWPSMAVAVDGAANVET